jgi:hypothetical protein
MRVAKMGYTQRVTKRNKRGRVTSSFERVRIVVPDGLPPSLPAPYTGHKNLTKKVHSDREHAEWTARFLTIIDEARGWTTIHRELAEINDLSLEDFIRRGSIPPVLPKLDGKMDEILGTPAWKEITAEPVTFEMMIPKWTAHTNAPKKGIADTRSTAKRFAKWLGHDDMAKVRFENARDYRDARLAGIEAAMEEDEDFNPSGPRKTLSNHLKGLKALFNYAADNYPDDFRRRPALSAGCTRRLWAAQRQDHRRYQRMAAQDGWNREDVLFAQA